MAETTTLGVIGGLGPIATAHFMELIIRMTEADTDQEHLDMILYNRPSIPDRTSYILDSTKPNPLPEMIRVGNALARQGAKLIAIPCMTAHYFHRELTRYIETPIVHAIHEVAAHLKKHGITRVGIMATDGSIRSGLFQQELQKHGIKPIIPGGENGHHPRRIEILHQERGHPTARDEKRNGDGVVDCGIGGSNAQLLLAVYVHPCPRRNLHADVEDLCDNAKIPPGRFCENTKNKFKINKIFGFLQ